MQLVGAPGVRLTRHDDGDESAGGVRGDGGVVPVTVASVAPDAVDITVTVDVSARGPAISTYLTGIAASYSAADMEAAGVTFTSFGGNPSTRYNYEIGHAWNHGADYEFRNTNYGQPTADAAREHVAVTAEIGGQARVAVPTLGWVARNDDENTCSFPDGAGGCQPASEVGTCDGDGPVADPARANVESTPERVAAWIEGLVADGLAPDIIAMDNEPELWGSTHYDVHPDCTTYEEVLDKYLTYAAAVRAVAPDAKLAGPAACCWYDYWNTAPGPEEGPFEEYLDWFLRSVKADDESTGQRSIDILDVHYYPQSDVFNDKTDEQTNARRLRSTRSLWDPTYQDESWIDTRITFIPRMKETIERNYPGLSLVISEWNFGADDTVNGALAIADTIGIYGREGVAAASYYFQPDVGSPGYMAFKMHGNYDDAGSRFGGDVVAVTSSDPDVVSAYAAVDDAGVARLMLINKDPADAHTVAISGAAGAGTAFTYGEATAGVIERRDVDVADPLQLAPYSITVVEVAAA